MLALGLAWSAGPGCLIGSPVAAISGEPYGMTRDDVRAIQGKRGHIWSGAPGFAVVDILFAAVLDTAFLPFALIVWGIKALASDEGDEDGHDEDQPHTHGGGEPHTHGEGGEPHTHSEGGEPHSHGEGSEPHTHGGDEPGHTHPRKAPAGQDDGGRGDPAPD